MGIGRGLNRIHVLLFCGRLSGIIWTAGFEVLEGDHIVMSSDKYLKKEMLPLKMVFFAAQNLKIRSKLASLQDKNV